MRLVKHIIKEVKEEEALLQMLKGAGDKVTPGDIEMVEKTQDTTSYDVYLNGEPYQFDVDKNGRVYYYNLSKAEELGFVGNIPQLVSNYKKLKGI